MLNKKTLSEYDPSQVPDGTGCRILLVISEWNPSITQSLADGARETLIQHGVNASDILTKYVPGSFELPLAAQHLLETRSLDAAILLGCVIQGETPHFTYVSQGVTQGCMEVGLKTGKPVIFGVLTTLNQQQAYDRAGGKHGNKGVEAAVTALKMISLLKSEGE